MARSGYTSASATSGATATAKGFTVSRSSGIDRYSTAVTVSKAEFPGTVGTVYLATGADYADALAAAPLAAGRAPRSSSPLRTLRPTPSRPSSND